MSHISPVAPPPPPPLLSPAAKGDNILNNLIVSPPSSPVPPPPSPSKSPTKNQIDECLWAREYPELQKACYLARICPMRPPNKCQYHDIAVILQEGPTCGLTALSMLLGGTPSPQKLLATAKDMHYTYNGEMFSARNLFQLIYDYLLLQMSSVNTNSDRQSTKTKQNENENNVEDRNDCRNDILAAERNKCAVIDCQMHEGPLNCAKVKECLLAGAYLFVPYPFQTN